MMVHMKETRVMLHVRDVLRFWLLLILIEVKVLAQSQVNFNEQENVLDHFVPACY